MSLFQPCQHCGSYMCSGGCMANAAKQQAMAQQYQAMLGQLAGAWSPTSTGMAQLIQGLTAVTEPKKESPKPLPETEEICATGGIVAWREWRVPNFGDTIYSLNGTEWPIRKPLRAKCGQAPNCFGARCNCGLYAWKERSNLKVNASEYNCISGEVWLWGKVIEHELGYRAEYSYPKAFVDSADARRIAQIYGVKTL